MKKEDDVLMNELIQSNSLLTGVNRKLLKKINGNNEQIDALKKEIERIQSNSIDSKYLNLIKEKINRKTQTLIKLNKEIEQLRKENLSKEEQNKIIRSLSKEVTLLTKESGKKERDLERVKVVLKEKDEVIKDFLKEVKDLRNNEQLFNKALYEMQDNLQNKDNLIIKMNGELENNRERLVQAKQAHKETAEKFSINKKHITLLAEDNQRLAKREENFKKLKIHLGRGREERIKLKKEMDRQQTIIEKISKKNQTVSDNLSFLLQLKTQIDNADLEHKKTITSQKQVINNLIKKVKKDA